MPAGQRPVGRVAGDRPAPRNDDLLRRRRHDHVLRACAEQVDCLVGELHQMLGRPVVAEAGRVVQRTLQLGVRHLSDHLAVGRQVEQRCRHLAGLALAAGVHHADAERQLPAKVLGHELLGRSGEVDGAAADLVRRLLHELAVAADDLGPALGREEQERQGRGRQRMQAELERGRDPEVPAASVEGPEELGVLVLARGHLPSVRRDEVDRDEAVAGETELPLEPAGAAAQGQARHAGRRHAPAGGAEPMRLGGPVEVTPGGPAADGRGAGIGIDRHGIDVPHVHDETVVDEAVARDAVPSAANRHGQALLACERERRDHIVRVRALRHVGRVPVDHRVEDRAGLVVTGVFGREHVAPEAGDAVVAHTCPLVSCRMPLGIFSRRLSISSPAVRLGGIQAPQEEET